MTFSLQELDERLAARAAASPDESYTASLIAKGIEKCAEKLGEESIEAVIAAVTADKQGLTNEAADVLYHLLVLLRASDVSLTDVMAELQSRTAQSGHAEKASRGKKARK